MATSATRLHRIGSGTCLIVAPFFLLIGTLLETRGPASLEDHLAAVAQHQTANEIGFAFGVYGFALMIPAVFGLVHVVRDRAVTLGHLGGGLALFGLVSFAFVAGTEFLLVAGADPALNRAAVIALNDRIGTSVVYNLLNMTEVVGVFLGFMLLAVALFRANVTPAIVPLLLAVSVVSRFALASFYAGVLLSQLLLVIALGYVGMRVLAQSDAAWQRPATGGPR